MLVLGVAVVAFGEWFTLDPSSTARTLSTLGYGEVPPVGAWARLFDIIETVTGPLFLAVWWAWNYTTWATNWVHPGRPRGPRPPLIAIAGLALFWLQALAVNPLVLSAAVAMVIIALALAARAPVSVRAWLRSPLTRSLRLT